MDQYVIYRFIIQTLLETYDHPRYAANDNHRYHLNQLQLQSQSIVYSTSTIPQSNVTIISCSVIIFQPVAV
jgi:hypothetical protein